MPHSITHGNACFTYFNKNWGNPDRERRRLIDRQARSQLRVAEKFEYLIR